MSGPRVGTARAAVMVAAGAPLELREYPVPAPGPGEVLVAVRCCTICRSDLHTWSGRRAAPLPLILGHEIVGEVVELGAGRSCDARGRPLRPGARVTWTIHDSCGACFYCRDLDLPMKCESLAKYGHGSCAAPPHFVGGFAEVCVLGAGTGIVELPPGIDDTVAAPANCALATVVAGLDAAQLAPGESVVIQGAGGLGCLAAAYARESGAARVLVTDVDPERLERAVRFGATDTWNVADLDDAEVAAAVRARTGGRGADLVLEVAGRPELIAQGLRCLRKGGRMIELGCSFPDARFELDASLLLWNMLTLRGVHNYAVRHLEAAVDFLAAAGDRVPFAELVTDTFPLHRIDDALRAAASGGGLRVAVVP